jgi:HAD superfamily hydrolase (TIGR01484 family)
MKKIIFACDMDNTLIHSHKKKLENDICVEYLDGNEQSYISPYTQELLNKLKSRSDILLLPVTTRSMAQYKRIMWHDDATPQLALTCNGSILLNNGEPDKDWLDCTYRMNKPYKEELKHLCEKYKRYECFKTVRIVDEMFLFVYCYNRDEMQDIAAKCAEDTSLSIEYSGNKMYFFPPYANKGFSLNRFRELYGADKIIAAGDSMIDCSMLDIADTALVPDNEMASLLKGENYKICEENKLFSEFILEYVLNL